MHKSERGLNGCRSLYPIKESKEASIVLFVSLRSKSSSPMNALKNTTIKIPKGTGVLIPISKPTVVP